MGFGNQTIRSLFIAKKLGARFDQVLTLGRQNLYCSKKELIDYAVEYSVNRSEIEAMPSEDNYSESFLHALGANHVDSMDVSDYEKATIVHDLNQPVPETFRNKYTVVVDSGTLEHIFDFPTAIKNCMEMLKVNGYFVTVTNGNNHMGHGFYQFSPELLYRVFSAENGFEVEQMYLGTVASNGKKETWYSVHDPAEVKSRITICNNKPVYIIMIAKKTAMAEIFSHPPQQSDYQQIWESASSDTGDPDTIGRSVKMYRKYMPSVFKKIIYYFRKLPNRNWDLGEIDPAHINKYKFNNTQR